MSNYSQSAPDCAEVQLTDVYRYASKPVIEQPMLKGAINLSRPGEEHASSRLHCSSLLEMTFSTLGECIKRLEEAISENGNGEHSR